ncbi:hypothetical protein SAY86_023953 [Trapa natans]|uniref:Uncharacterized protein n=1 Tax=Trapa natans TaxID=22666 RepID=A0AAN7RBZ4_TRANT|nr:hypothetical protein SAY86_023953 [Trapa natans]
MLEICFRSRLLNLLLNQNACRLLGGHPTERLPIIWSGNCGGKGAGLLTLKAVAVAPPLPVLSFHRPTAGGGFCGRDPAPSAGAVPGGPTTAVLLWADRMRGTLLVIRRPFSPVAWLCLPEPSNFRESLA